MEYRVTLHYTDTTGRDPEETFVTTIEVEDPKPGKRKLLQLTINEWHKTLYQSNNYEIEDFEFEPIKTEK